jgi:hypothetical protein
MDAMQHSLLWDNCHSHVALALSRMQYRHRLYNNWLTIGRWNNITVALLVLLAGEYVDGWPRGWLRVNGPALLIYSSCIIAIIIIAVL